MHKEITLEQGISIESLVAIARNGAKVVFSPSYEARVQRCRSHVERFEQEEALIYGLTTGLGDNCTVFIPEADRITIQRNHILAHSCAVGEPLEEECTRAMMVVMLAHFGTGYTGIRLETLALLRDMLNKGVTPLVPRHGSVGYLCLESYIGLVLIGEGQALYQGEVLPGAQALAQAGLAPTVLGSKEGLTLVSGTTSVTAHAALAFYDGQMLARTADVTGAMTLEMLKGNLMAMDPRIMATRPHSDQSKTAQNICRLLADSQILQSTAREKIQDALSLRCIPQLHGPVKQAVRQGYETVEIELHSTVDNPLIFEDDHGEITALMGCNCDGTYVGLSCDQLCVALGNLGKMVERRLDRLVNGHVSGLPPFLNQNSAFCNGLMMIQYTAAGLVGELRLKAHPATVDSVPTCAFQEDYVSMGYNAARKAYESVSLARYLLAIELICSTQALDCIPQSPTPASATTAVYQLVRTVMPRLDSDAPLGPYTEAVADLIGKGDVLHTAEQSVGTLLY